MANLKQTRNWLIAVLLALLILDAAVLAFLFSPFTQNSAAREQALAQAQNDLGIKSKEAEPLRGMDEKLKKTESDLDAFYHNRMPARDSAVATELGKLAQANRVQLANEKYEEKESELPGITRVNISASLDGEYLNIVKFIGALEKDKMFFILDGINLTGQQGGAVKLDLKLETFLK